MQNERDYLYHYEKYLQNQDFEIIFWKIVHGLLVYEILNNNIFIYLIGSNKLLFLNYLTDQV